MISVEADPALQALPADERERALSAVRRFMDYEDFPEYHYHTDGTPPSLIGTRREYEDGSEVWVNSDGEPL